MRRNAFSLIELLFVIIILGIISSIAIAKMGQMADRTRVTNLKAFVGTLNRSVSAAIWFKSIEQNRNGSVAFADYQTDLDNFIDIVPNYSSGPSLVNCNNVGDGIFLSYIYEKNYEIHCKDGTTTTSPIFKLYNQSDGFYLE